MNTSLSEFDEIRPYEPSEMKQAFEDLINDRQFARVLKGFAPWIPKGVRNALLRMAFVGIKTPLDFQMRFMKPVVKWIMHRHTSGCSFDDKALRSAMAAPGGGNMADARFTFISNHRDIVLDSALLDVLLVNAKYPTTVEIGIGDNLLIYPWIKRLVRMNKAFTVRRGLTPHEMLNSSQLMSRYIHFAVTQKHENIWIAQREGRAKDSDDRTQESVLKMLAMGGELSELNIVPLTISYEFDPCDFLKAQEMQQKRDNPSFRKSRQDDLDNMSTGIFGYKGRVHYRCGTPINAWLQELDGLSKKEYYETLARRFDRELHSGYTLYPCNYIALDRVNGNRDKAAHYTADDERKFDEYLSRQLGKINIPNKDENFLRERMLTMYANPLRNYLAAQ